MIYDTTVLHRGKVTKLEDLRPSSSKKVGITCPDCGKHIDRVARILFETGNFLCHACTILDKQAVTLEVGSTYSMFTILGKHSTGRSIVKCECGKVKDVNNTAITSGTTRSCGCSVSASLKKFHKLNPTANSGENHPGWKGGVSTDRARHMTTNEYKNWRTAVFTRDLFKCQRCGINSNELEAHHIVPYAVAPALRVDVSNGITFCKMCHKEYHSIYGQKDLNREQIEAFKQTNN